MKLSKLDYIEGFLDAFALVSGPEWFVVDGCIRRRTLPWTELECPLTALAREVLGIAHWSAWDDWRSLDLVSAIDDIIRAADGGPGVLRSALREALGMQEGV